MPLLRWNPASEPSAVITSGSITGLPDYIESLAVGSAQFYGLQGNAAPPKGSVDSDLSFLTIPQGFRRYIVGRSTTLAALIPSNQITTNTIHGPFLLYQKAPASPSKISIQAGHFCQGLGLLGGKFACAKAFFIMDGTDEELLVFKYNDTMLFYDADSDSQVEKDMSSYFLTPVFLPNQNAVYVAFNEDEFLSKWQAARPININIHLVAIHKPALYCEKNDIWVTFDAGILP